MAIFGYARDLPQGQTLDSQLKELKAARCEKIFKEKTGNDRGDRPQLAKLLAAIGNGDVLIVTRLERLARSTRDLLNIIEALRHRGAFFRSLNDEWADTTTEQGRLMLPVLGGLATFENELIRARTGGGRVRAKARGQHMGRPQTLSQDQQAFALKALTNETATQADLARQFNVSPSTISRLAAKEIVQPTQPRIDKDTAQAARSFLRLIEEKVHPVDALLYGSRARGTHRADSDADIAVILKGRRGDRYKVLGSLSDAAYDVLLETGIHIQPLPLWEKEFERPELFSNPALIENIKREGLHL